MSDVNDCDTPYIMSLHSLQNAAAFYQRTVGFFLILLSFKANEWLRAFV